MVRQAWRAAYAFGTTSAAIFLIALAIDSIGAETPADLTGGRTSAPRGNDEVARETRARELATKRMAREHYELARAATEDARTALVEVTRRLDSLRSELSRRSVRGLPGVSARGKARPAVESLPTAAQARLSQLEQSRGELMKRMTPEHPQIRQIDVQIADARREIAPVLRSHAQAEDAEASPSREVANRLQECEEAVARARELVAEQEARKREAWDHLLTDSGSELRKLEQASAITPVARSGGTAAPLRTSAVVWIGLAAGLMCASFVSFTHFRTGGMFDNVAQLESCLMLPVVGQLAGAPAHRARFSRIHLVSGIRLASEIVLACLVGWFAVLMAVDSPFAARFFADPWLTFAEGISRLRAVMGN